MKSMLKPYRVIDLSNERGLLCGQILADLGADVIQVESPGGSSARRVGPWLKGERGQERSLFWWPYFLLRWRYSPQYPGRGSVAVEKLALGAATSPVA